MYLVEDTDNLGEEVISRERLASAQVFYERALRYIDELGGLISMSRREELEKHLCDLSLEISKDPHPSLNVDESERSLLEKGELSRELRFKLQDAILGYLERNSL